jgi:glycogen synthase
LWSLEVEKGLSVYFIDQPEFYFPRRNLSGRRHQLRRQRRRGSFFSPNASRISRGICRGDRTSSTSTTGRPALVPALMLQQHRAEGWGNPPPACLTIHNLAYQGVFPPARLR